MTGSWDLKVVITSNETTNKVLTSCMKEKATA